MDTKMIIEELKKCKNIEELRKVNSYCYKKIGILNQLLILEFSLGDKISWDSIKEGCVKTGKIIKISRKKVQVKIENVVWTLPASIIRKALPS